LKATYESHVLDESPSNLKSRSFEQSKVGAGLGNGVGGSGVGTKVGGTVRSKLGPELKLALGERLGFIL